MWKVVVATTILIFVAIIFFMIDNGRSILPIAAPTTAGLFALIYLCSVNPAVFTGGDKNKLFTNQNVYNMVRGFDGGFKEHFFRTLLSFALPADKGVFLGPLKGLAGAADVTTRETLIKSVPKQLQQKAIDGLNKYFNSNPKPEDYNFGWCFYVNFKDNSRVPMEIDAYNFNKRIIMEFNGVYHYDVTYTNISKNKRDNEDRYINQRRNDFLKQMLAAVQKIYFITIPNTFVDQYLNHDGEYDRAEKAIGVYLENEAIYRKGLMSSPGQKINYLAAFNKYVEFGEPEMDFELDCMLSALTQIRNTCQLYKYLFFELYLQNEKSRKFVMNNGDYKVFYTNFGDVTVEEVIAALDMMLESNYFYPTDFVKNGDDIVLDPKRFNKISDDEYEEREAFMQLKYFSRYNSKEAKNSNDYQKDCYIVARYINLCLNRACREHFVRGRFMK